jgi:hypothetical protein
METVINLIIQLISGVVGGNAAGAALKDYNLGNLGNTIARAIGGVAEAKFCKPSFRRSQTRPAAASISGPSWVKSSAAAPEARSSPSSPDW